MEKRTNKTKQGKMKRIISAIFCCLFIATATAKPVMNEVTGTVTDKETGTTLPHITVTVRGTMLACETDINGKFSLRGLPVGEQTLEVRAVGYRSKEQKINITTTSNHVFDFVLEADEISLDEVVVSANRNLSLRRNAPTLVSVIDNHIFDLTHSVCLAQGLNFQPGVRTEDNCQNCGFSQVRINGLDGHYSQILIDSRPVFSALQGVYGLEQIPANMIERVEVVRGGGSALYGSSAIGGTINIITKEPRGNSADLSHSFSAFEGFNAFENNTTANVSIVADNNKAGMSIYGHSRQRGGYDHDNDGFTDLPKLINKTIGLSSFLRLSTYSKLSLHYHSQSEFRRGGNKLYLPAHEANIAEQLDHNINGGSLGYDLFTNDGDNHLSVFASFETVSRKSYYGGTGDDSEEKRAEALKAYSKTHDCNIMTGIQFVHNFSRLLFMPAGLTVGAEYSHDNLTDRSLGYGTLTKQKASTASMFLQNEWKTEQWSLLLGGRIDKHNLIKHLIFSPRVNLRYNPTQDINLRLTYAGGFRAPQAFDEDLHTTLAGGERIKTVLSKDLKEERSNSISLSADTYHSFGKVQTNLLVEGFFTVLDDVFATRKLDKADENGIGIIERYNANRATVIGLNLEGKAVFNRWLQLQAGLTLQKSEYREAVVWDENAPAEKRFLRTPDVYGYFTANLTPVKNFSAAITGNYTGGMLVGHAVGSGVSAPVAVNTPSFTVLNIKLAYDLKLYKTINAEINCGVRNITNAYQKDIDKGWERDAAYIYGPSSPRCYFVGMKISY